VKRGPGPKRDPTKIAAWQLKSQEAAARKARERPRTAPVRRSEGLKRRDVPGGKRRPVPRHIRRAVFARSNGLCVVCGGRAAHLHHVLPVQRWPEHEHEPRNMVAVCPGCHDNHERAHRRIRRGELSAAVLDWATTACGWYVEKVYRE
jgi:5-methylcytosine-specific restriction endonuclease McrA